METLREEDSGVDTQCEFLGLLSQSGIILIWPSSLRSRYRPVRTAMGFTITSANITPTKEYSAVWTSVGEISVIFLSNNQVDWL